MPDSLLCHWRQHRNAHWDILRLAKQISLVRLADAHTVKILNDYEELLMIGLKIDDFFPFW